MVRHPRPRRQLRFDSSQVMPSIGHMAAILLHL
jgi:hypothetical protein